MSKRILRSNFEPGTTREVVRRAQWRALGLSDADMLKPKIAVVNSSSELAICFSHLDGVAKVVKEAVRAAGGLPFEVRTAAPSDFIISAGGSGYILASRDLVVNDMEIAIQGAQLDGMICLTSCDKTPPAHLMAAGRFNIPTDHRRLRVSAERRIPRQARRHRGRVPGVRASAVRQARPRGAHADEQQRNPRAGRLLRHGDGELDARRLRGARDEPAGKCAGRGEQRGDVRPMRASPVSASWKWCGRT